MRSHTFHWELRDIIAQFSNAFNDIVIKRYNIDKEPEDQLHVNFLYAPKTRTLHDLVQKNQHIKMPIVSVSNGGFRRAPERVFSKIEGSYWADTKSPVTSAWVHLLQPVPIDLTINMSIIGRFQTDIDQILTNFIPYCDPYIVVSWKWPDIIPWSDFEIRSHIKWNENVAISYPLDINASQPYRVIADTSFTIESWMFKNSPPPGKPIYVIDTNFASVSAIEEYERMKAREDEYNTDHYTDYTVISARPQFVNVDPFVINTNRESDITCYGRMLDYVETVYLSSSDWSMFDISSSSPLSAGVTYVQDLTTKSTIYSGFSGIRVEDNAINYISQNAFSLSLTMANSGYFDIIAVNSAGYGYLTKDSIRPTTNPYSLNSTDYNNYVEFQYPCVSGVQVKSLP